MTRINLIAPIDLTREHLVAEYRELPRCFSLAVNWYKKGISKNIDMKRQCEICLPSCYILGTGHVRFFYDKLEFLRKRHKSLVNEMKRRGYKTNIDCSKNALDMPDFMQNDWVPDKFSININEKLILNRLQF